jgi:hypothetical protein
MRVFPRPSHPTETAFRTIGEPAFRKRCRASSLPQSIERHQRLAGPITGRSASGTTRAPFEYWLAPEAQ